MKKWLLIVSLMAAGLVGVPGETEACWRCWRNRFARPPVTPCPPVYYTRTVIVPPIFEQPTPAQWETTIRNKRYVFVESGDAGDHKPETLAPELTKEGAKKSKDPNVFLGHARFVAKTTIAVAPTEDFASVNALLNSLPPDSFMQGLNIGPNTPRVQQEQRNVSVTCFIYTFKKEKDNDYHVIIGDAPGTPNLRFFNVEVSGIPPGGTLATKMRLTEVRDTFKTAFSLKEHGPGSYPKSLVPVPVRLGGSLFFDSEHEAPHFVGPKSHKPKTAWEIHPVTSIDFTP